MNFKIIIGGLLFIALWGYVKQLHPNLKKISTTAFLLIFPFSHLGTILLLIFAFSTWWSALILIITVIGLALWGWLSIKFRDNILIPILPFTLPAVLVVIIMSLC